METRRISGFQTERLLQPGRALESFFEVMQPPELQKERVPLAGACGRVLCEDVACAADVPAAPRSAMDGFAIRSADVPGALRIAGSVRMGEAAEGALRPGEAVRIPTGGDVPAGADAVVPIEDVRADGERIRIDEAVSAGENVTPAGSDMRAGEVLLRRGRRLTASDVGILATLGCEDVDVYRRPRVAIVSTGDELVAIGQAPGPGQVRDSNRWAIAALAERLGAEPVHVPTPKDEPAAIEAALREALARADAVVLTGGSSVGERDLTPEIVDRLGEPGVVVHGLRIKPGKPTVLALAGAKPVIGLPGNPTSALVVFDAVGAPVLRTLTGWDARRYVVKATLTGPVTKRPGWTWYVPVRLHGDDSSLKADPLQIRSSMVSLLARANGYVTLGEAVERLEVGTVVDVRVLEAQE